MLTAQETIRAVRAAAVWLLMVAVFLGPAGLGGSEGYSAALGAGCPCDEAHDDHPDETSEHSEAESGHEDADPFGEDADPCGEDADPCEDACPDDCPNCGCCLGIAMAVLPHSVMSSATAWTSVPMLAPPVVRSGSTGTGVFRPPRV